MKKDKLNLKDFVNIGIFTIIYFIAIAIIGSPFGITVIAFLVYPFFAALLTGTITIYYMSKLQKKWSVFILSIFPGILMTFMGHTLIVFFHSLIIAFIAEFFYRKSDFKKESAYILIHAIIGLWMVGAFWQIFIFVDKYKIMIKDIMGELYANQLLSLPIWIMPMLYIICFIGGLIGGKIGIKILKKHLFLVSK